MEHTNEELVTLIQQGNKSLIPQLWEQVYRFIYRQAKRRLLKEPAHLQDMEDDMVNEAYFGFVSAVYGFKDDKEASFLHYLNFNIKNSFNNVLNARTQAGRKAPDRTAARLDAPIGETEDLTLQDILLDPLAEEEYRQVETDDFWGDVNRLLREVIDIAAHGDTHRVLVYMLDHGVGVSEACKGIGLNPAPIYAPSRQALYKMRRMLIHTSRRRQCQEMGLSDYFRGSHGAGLSAFRRRNFTSITESLAIEKIDREERQRRIAELWG